MKLSRILTSPHALLLGGLLLAGAASGCQSTVGGQTLPSPNYLRDDVQFFPAGPEFKLSNQVRALEEYKAAQAGIGGDLGPAPIP